MDTKEYIKESNIKKNNNIIGGEKSVFKEYRKRIEESEIEKNLSF